MIAAQFEAPCKWCPELILVGDEIERVKYWGWVHSPECVGAIALAVEKERMSPSNRPGVRPT